MCYLWFYTIFRSNTPTDDIVSVYLACLLVVPFTLKYIAPSLLGVCVCLCAIVLFCILYNFCLFLLVSVWKMQSRRRSMKWKRNETQQITQLSWAKLKIAITKKSRGGGKQEHADIAYTHTQPHENEFSGFYPMYVREKDWVCIDIGIFCIARVPPKGKGLTMAL